MKYILVYLLLTGFSYANTSLDQEYANIENKFAIKETELLQWFSNSVEGINHNSQNKIKLTYDKISDEKDRKEEIEDVPQTLQEPPPPPPEISSGLLIR